MLVFFRVVIIAPDGSETYCDNGRLFKYYDEACKRMAYYEVRHIRVRLETCTLPLTSKEFKYV